MRRASRGPAIDLTPRLLVQSVAYCSLQSANTCCLQLSRSEREAVASCCISAQSRVIAVLHREHNHEAHCVRCHRVHGGRIRRAGPVPGGAAGGEDLGVLGRLSLQTLPRRRSSATRAGSSTARARALWGGTSSRCRAVSPRRRWRSWSWSPEVCVKSRIILLLFARST